MQYDDGGIPSALTAHHMSQQLQHAEHAWSTLEGTLQPWGSHAGTAVAGARAASAASFVPPSAVPAMPASSSLRSAYATLRSLQLDRLFHAHVRDELLQPYMQALLQHVWWPHVEQIQTLQCHYFATHSAPSRFHPSLNAWLLHSMPALVRRCHELLQPLLQRLQLIDAALSAPDSHTKSPLTLTLPPPSLYLAARRLLHTLFVTSLSEACPPPPTGGAATRRSALLQELLFKYYRINFRVFTRCAKERAAAAGAAHAVPDAHEQDDDAPDEEEAEEEDAAAALESDAAGEDASAPMSDGEAVSSTQEVIAAAAALPRVQYSEEELSQFASTCALLLDLHFLGPSDDSTPVSSQVVAAGGAPPPSSASADCSFLPPPCLPSSYYLDFFFLLLHQYMSAPAHSVAESMDRDQLGPLRRWMENKLRPFMHIIVTGKEEQGETKGKQQQTTTTTNPSFLHCYSRLHLYCLELFGSSRLLSSALFTLVKCFPDSLPALGNLREALGTTKQYGVAVGELAQSFRQRVLLPSTDTRSILEQYVHAVHALRTLDPPGMHGLLAGFHASSGVTQYIRARGDTRAHVVAALWGGTDARREEARLEEEREEREMRGEDGDESMEDDQAEKDETPLLGGGLNDADPATAAPVEGALDLTAQLEATPDAGAGGGGGGGGGSGGGGGGVAAGAAAAGGDDSDAEDAAPPLDVVGAPGGADVDGAAARRAAQLARVDFHPSDLWQPEPVEQGDNAAASAFASSASAAGNSSARYLRHADLLSLLIDLCGSGERNEELLLLEYKNFISQRLMRKRSNVGKKMAGASSASSSSASRSVLWQSSKDPLYDTESEVTHLELMKLRFGDLNPSLQDVEVMLKDVTNSKRIQAQIVAPVAAASASASAAAAADQSQTKLMQALLDRHARLRDSEDQEEQAQYALEVAQGALKQQMELASRFSALMLSSEFWPDADAISNEAGFEFRMPAVLRGVCDAYAAMFHTLKAPRVLQWASGSGGPDAGQVVELELEMRDGRMLRVECEPIHAAILELFAEPGEDTSGREERTRWSLTELAEQLSVDDEEELAGKVAFWLQKGLLRVAPPTRPNDADESIASDGDDDDAAPVYELVEQAWQMEDAESGGGGSGAAGDTENTGGLSAKQREEQAKLVESYVLGALNNFASMSVSQLHHMLKLFNVPGFLYTYSEAELRVLLNGLHARGTLTLNDGLYTRSGKLAATG